MGDFWGAEEFHKNFNSINGASYLSLNTEKGIRYLKAIENKFDYGIAAGAGLELSTGIGHFLLEGRYYMGLGDFYKSTKKDYFGRSAHSYIGVRATYLFDITK